MLRSRRLPVVSVGQAMAVMSLAAGCEIASHGKSEPVSAPTARVEVVRPVRQTIRRTVDVPALVVAYETTPVYAKLAGYVDAVNVNIGDRVRRGDLLAVLSAPEVEADVTQKRAMIDQAESLKRQANADVEVARASLARTEARLLEVRAAVGRAEAEQARYQSESNRADELVRQHATTVAVLDEAKSRLLAAQSSRDEAIAQVKSSEAAVAESRSVLARVQAHVAVAESNVEVARAEAGRAQALWQYRNIVAPFDGVITKRHVDTGHLTAPGASAEPPLFVVARSDIIRFVADVPEGLAAAVDPGDTIRFRIPALGTSVLEGKVTRTSWALDSKSRTVRAETDLPNPDGKLRAGLYAHASVVVDEHREVLTIPNSALISESDSVFCVVVTDGKARRRPLQLGISDGVTTEIVSGVASSDQVVRAFAATLKDGQPVEPMSAPAP